MADTRGMTTTQTYETGTRIRFGVQRRKATVLAAWELGDGEWMLQIETTDSLGFACERDLWVGLDTIIETIG